MQVLTTAKTAMPPALSAEPPLKPSHPNQSMPVPSATKVRLWGTFQEKSFNLKLSSNEVHYTASISKSFV